MRNEESQIGSCRRIVPGPRWSTSACTSASVDLLHEIVAYCRGPYCVLSYEAVAALRTKGFKARRLEDGFPERGVETQRGAFRFEQRREF
jgi:hypothetical protein